MDINEIEKKLKEFQATMKPVEVTKKPGKPSGVKKPTPQEVEAAGPPPFEPVQPVPEEAVPCFNPHFKELLANLNPGYIGKNNAATLLTEFLGQVPECEAS